MFDDQFASFVQQIQARAEKLMLDNPVFSTDVSNLWETYLDSFPTEQTDYPQFPSDLRQYHNCNCCRHFIQRYGGLVFINQYGRTESVFWHATTIPGLYYEAFRRMAQLVESANVTGQFLSSERIWGNVQEGGWDHFGFTQPTQTVFKARSDNPMTAHQVMQLKKQQHETLQRGIEAYPKEILEKALTVLKSGVLYRGDKFVSQMKWLVDNHTTKFGNKFWLTVAKAQPNYCNPRAGMVGTLLDDLVAGKTVEQIKGAFDDKMREYMRSTVDPTDGNKEAAEKFVEDYGLAPSLQRRYATLSELQTMWKPAVAQQKSGSVFGHLPTKAKTPVDQPIMPATTMTWEKFKRTVLPDVIDMEVLIPSEMNRFAALVTAVNPDAPCLFKWDNHFSWYYESGVDGEMKRRVVAAGGQYENVDIRASLMWNNRNDLDLHVMTPEGRHLYYGCKRVGNGWLDIDMNISGETTTPVENVRWPKGTATTGTYKVWVENFRFHEPNRIGTQFSIEIEVAGKVMQFTGETPRMATQNDSTVEVCHIVFDHSGNHRIIPRHCQSTSSGASWGVSPGAWAKVNAVVPSPNQWGDSVPPSESHMFFVIDGCKDANDGVGRGFFAEMLKPSLHQIRSTLESFAKHSEIQVDGAPTCGLGFTATGEWNLRLKVRTADSVREVLIDRFD